MEEEVEENSIEPDVSQLPRIIQLAISFFYAIKNFFLDATWFL